MKNPGWRRKIGLVLGLLVLLACHGAGMVRAAAPGEEQQLIGVLRSSAGPREKDAACARLKRIGTACAVPALAALLTDPDLSHSARYALESQPMPEAGRALLAALDKTEGLTKAGIIQSLGVRREARAVPALVRSLSDADSAVAGAAASALGGIGGPRAAKALQAALPAAAGPKRDAILDGLLAVAEDQLSSGAPREAAALFQQLDRTDLPDHVRTAAYGGTIRAAGDGALKRIIDALSGGDGAHQLAALQTAREIKDPAATKALAALLPRLSPPLQIAVAGVLEQRGDPAAAPALIAIAGSADANVRVAAVKALGRAGDATAVPRLALAAAAGNEGERKAARQALRDLEDVPQVTDVILTQMTSEAPKIHAEMVRALIARDDQRAVPRLIQLARDGTDAERQPACQVLVQLAGPPHIVELVRLVMAAPEEVYRAQTLRSVCCRLQEEGKRFDVEPIVKGLSSDRIAVRMAFMQTASVLTDARIRTALRDAVNASDTILREAARSALTETRDPALLPDLLAVARQATTPKSRTVAVRGYLRLAAPETSPMLAPAQRAEALRQILPLMANTEEKWLLLSALANIPCPEALELAVGLLGDPATRGEAAQAVIKIAGALPPEQAPAARAALKRVLAVATDPTQRQSAEEALNKLDAAPLPPAPPASPKTSITAQERGLRVYPGSRKVDTTEPTDLSRQHSVWIKRPKPGHPNDPDFAREVCGRCVLFF